MSVVECPSPPRLERRRALFPSLAIPALVAYCSFLFFYGLGAGQLYRTEGLRAIIAAEFLRTGNWIVPTLYGEPLLTKPPGMYAAIALVSWPQGQVTEWSARLPSALAASGTVLVFALYFRRQLGPLGGGLAALLLPVSLMWLDKATAAEIDMFQVFWVTTAIICLLRALELEEAGGNVWGWWLAGLLCVAGGVLTKWTAPAFFYGTAIPLLWVRGQLRLLWCRRHVVSALLGASVCFAWVGAVVVQIGWEGFYGTVSREALMRLSPAHHHRPYPWDETLTHPFRVFFAALPVSAFALLTFRPGFAGTWTERQRQLLQALHCWVWPNLLFWSLAPEHSIRHSFPLYPGVAGLAVMYCVNWLRQTEVHRGWRSPGRILLGLVVAWLAVKVAFVHGVTPARSRSRQPQEKAAQITALVPGEEILYLSMLKDEGIMFYYGRPVRRLASPAQLLSSAKPRYGILDAAEWRACEPSRRAEVLLNLRDEQGAPIVLVRVNGPACGEKGEP